MKISSFLKDKLPQISLLFFGLLTIEIFLAAYPFGTFVKIYIAVSILILDFISILIEFLSKNKFYKNTENMLDELDDKYLLAEVIEKPNFSEGKFLKDILEQTDKSMIENVNKYKYWAEDYKEYIEMWIHEVKIPIASRQNDY